MSAPRGTVLVIGPFAETAGGVVTFQKNLVERSRLKERWRFVRHSNSRPPKEDVTDNHRYGALFNAGPRRFVVGAVVTARNLARLPGVIRRERPDVAQIQSSDLLVFWESAAYLWVCHRMGVPAVVRFGGAFDHFFDGSGSIARRLIRRVLRSPERIVVQSEGWKERFAALTDARRLVVVPNAVPDPPPAPERPARTTGVRALWLATADARRKGLETVLAAAPSLRGVVEVHAYAAGAPVRERVAALGLADVIVCHGVVSRDEMDRAYREADLFLIPSFGEGFPNSMLEAMRHALPVIGAPVGAIPEVIDADGGVLVAADDAAGLARSALRLAGDPGLRAAMGAHNREVVRTRYALDVVFARFDALWADAIAEGRRR